jgi:hypothetical protein
MSNEYPYLLEITWHLYISQWQSHRKIYKFKLKISELIINKCWEFQDFLVSLINHPQKKSNHHQGAGPKPQKRREGEGTPSLTVCHHDFFLFMQKCETGDTSTIL